MRLVPVPTLARVRNAGVTASMEAPVAKQERSFLDTAADKMRVPERVESDNVLKWDGERLYVTERTYRGEHRSGERKRDVSREVAIHLASLTKDGGS